MHTLSEPTKSTRGADPAIAGTRAFLDALFPAPRDFSFRLWDGSEVGGEEGSRYTLVLKGPGTPRRMFGLPVELALGEAYFFGDFDIEGDILDAVQLKERARAAVSTPGRLLRILRLRQRLPRDPERREGERVARLRGRLGTRDRDRRAVQYHYDLGNAFYSLWLDRRMVYSCAYFPSGGEELDRAQELKLDLICRKLRLRSGERFLDIGCGWGALCIHAAREYGARVVGVTLSEQQARLARDRVAAAGLEARVEIRLLDFRDLDGSFEKIASVGMFEHVKDHADYFSQVHRLLAPQGLFLNHSIATTPASNAWGKHTRRKRLLQEHVLGTGLIRDRYVFPDVHLAPVSEANLVAERAGFEVRDVENLREHYALTLRHWTERLEENREEAIRTAGEFVYRVWRVTFSAASRDFERGNSILVQTLFAKPDAGDAGLPWSRADLYASVRRGIHTPASTERTADDRRW